MNKLCHFCNSSTENMRETLYGIFICEECHKRLVKIFCKIKGVSLPRIYEDYASKMPFSRTLNEISVRHYENPLGCLVLLLPFVCGPILAALPIGITFVAILIILLFILSFFLFGFVERYTAQRSKEKAIAENKDLIQKELRESEEKIKEEENKELEICNKISKDNILLHEYCFYEYPPDWERRAQEARVRDNYTCCNRKCGSKSELHIHHKIPVKKGGDHFLDNLITLCGKCHLKEHPYLTEFGWEAKGEQR